MRRDMDLIRLLLLDVEGETEIDLSPYSEGQIIYHQKLLIEAELVVGNFTEVPHPRKIGEFQVVSMSLVRLTWEGHDFLDAARNESGTRQ